MKTFTIVTTILFSIILLHLSVDVSGAIKLTFGIKGKLDRLLARDVIHKDRGLFGNQRMIAVYENKVNDSFSRISGISVEDLANQKSHPKLVAGGPGERTATVKLRSPNGKPIHALIEYYGH